MHWFSERCAGRARAKDFTTVSPYSNIGLEITISKEQRMKPNIGY
jgi:hypothetical protein